MLIRKLVRDFANYRNTKRVVEVSFGRLEVQ